LVQISDAGADVLLDALVMDRNMVLLDMSANQLTMKRYTLHPWQFARRLCFLGVTLFCTASYAHVHVADCVLEELGQLPWSCMHILYISTVKTNTAYSRQTLKQPFDASAHNNI